MKLLLLKQPLASGSGEVLETRDSDSWVGLNQVWAVCEMFGFWLICFLFLSYSACALTWHR